MVKFDINNINLFTTNILPVPSKKEYSSLCEVVEEFFGNF